MLSRKATPRLKDAGQARTDIERLVCWLLETEEPCIVSEMVQRIANEMYYDELKHGGWVADIGIFGPSLFRRDALAVVDAMKDRCLSVESENDR